MDHIAGEVGFFDPIFRPALFSHVSKQQPLTFAAVDGIREQFCPQASFQSTLIACVKRSPIPILYVEAGWGLKRHEQQSIETPRLFSMPAPEKKLRALVAVANDHARKARLRVDWNMEIPAASLIAKAFSAPPSIVGGLLQGKENLNIWRHSNGEAIGHDQVQVEVRRAGERALAILQPLRI